MKSKMTIGGVTFDTRLTLIIILGTILPMVDYYGHRITGTKAYDRLVLYFVIPMVLILVIFRDNPAEFGFRVGNWRIGLLWTLAGCALMALVLWVVARTPAMQQYYAARAPQGTFRLIYLNAVDLFGWEFIWRGLLLFSLARAVGPGPAIFLQAVPFAFMHLGKPELETMTTIFGGAIFGFIAWQSNSFFYPFLIHWFISSFTMAVASGRLG